MAVIMTSLHDPGQRLWLPPASKEIILTGTDIMSLGVYSNSECTLKMAIHMRMTKWQFLIVGYNGNYRFDKRAVIMTKDSTSKL